MRAHVVAFQFFLSMIHIHKPSPLPYMREQDFLAHRAGHSVVITFAGTIVLDFRSLTANCVVWSPVYLAASQRGTVISTLNKNVHNFFQITLQLLPQKIFPMWKWVVGVCWWIIQIATPGTTTIFMMAKSMWNNWFQTGFQSFDIVHSQNTWAGNQLLCCSGPLWVLPGGNKGWLPLTFWKGQYLSLCQNSLSYFLCDWRVIVSNWNRYLRSMLSCIVSQFYSNVWPHHF